MTIRRRQMAGMSVAPAAGWLRRHLQDWAERPRRLQSTGPEPPRRLRARTGAPGLGDWVQGGRKAADELAALLAQGFSSAQSILDFGCGSGRVLPHVAARAPQARCAGTDVDPDAIAWARAHHPGLSFARSSYEPPLPFEASAFDLVYSISVFSHLDEPHQDAWLAELARLLAPGGIALLSVHGPFAFEQFRSGQVRTSWCPPGAFDRPPLQDGELVFVPYLRSRWNRGELPGVGTGYGLAFHGGGYLSERWSKWLEVERIAPRALTGWQDVVICRGRVDGGADRG